MLGQYDFFSFIRISPIPFSWSESGPVWLSFEITVAMQSLEIPKASQNVVRTYLLLLRMDSFEWQSLVQKERDSLSRWTHWSARKRKGSKPCNNVEISLWEWGSTGVGAERVHTILSLGDTQNFTEQDLGQADWAWKSRFEECLASVSSRGPFQTVSYSNSIIYGKFSGKVQCMYSLT